MTITVKKLIRALQELEKEGLGECKILLSVDDEGNYFREPHYTTTELSGDELEDFKEYDLIPENFKGEKQIILIG